MISVDITAKAFHGTEVLRDIHFQVKRGETVALLGPSGIGKTTLLRIVAGIDADFEGKITRPNRVAMVFQEPTLLSWRSTLENITLIHPNLGLTSAQAALERVRLAGKADLFPGQLSLGQQRRLALARAFAGQPEFLIMDEPFVSLDASMVDEMLSLTETLIAEVQPATIFVTHAAAEAEQLATRSLTLAGSPATLQP